MTSITNHYLFDTGFTKFFSGESQWRRNGGIFDWLFLLEFFVSSILDFSLLMLHCFTYFSHKTIFFLDSLIKQMQTFQRTKFFAMFLFTFSAGKLITLLEKFQKWRNLAKIKILNCKYLFITQDYSGKQLSVD